MGLLCLPLLVVVEEVSETVSSVRGLRTLKFLRASAESASGNRDVQRRSERFPARIPQAGSIVPCRRGSMVASRGQGASASSLSHLLLSLENIENISNLYLFAIRVLMPRFIEPVSLLLLEFGRIKVSLNELTVFKSPCFQS